jgi:hypothetical protein
MNYSYFLTKLSEAQKFEDKAIELICNKFNTELTSRQTEANYNEMKYDFHTLNDMSFEVKADSMSLKTGNFFIETDNKKGYSGISITDAEYHIICNTVDYYLLPTFQIKELLASGQYSKRYVKDGTCGRIIPCNDIIKLSIKLN